MINSFALIHVIITTMTTGNILFLFISVHSEITGASMLGKNRVLFQFRGDIVSFKHGY